jgi:hypothetical protein
MTQSAPPPHGVPSAAAKTVGMPTFGTVPLGPDEPELFANAMERILEHLESSDGTPASPRHRK